jgi:hypothetical protein
MRMRLRWWRSWARMSLTRASARKFKQFRPHLHKERTRPINLNHK